VGGGGQKDVADPVAERRDEVGLLVQGIGERL
jgi:hypothetical protein